MTFADIVAGDTVFLDANAFLFFFSSHPNFGNSADALLRQVEVGQVTGFTSTHVIAEVSHRLMMVEAANAHGWVSGKVKARLKKHPGTLQNLTRFRTAVELILQSKVRVLLTTPPILAASTLISQQCGLLTNDAITVALMQVNGLDKIASEDNEFDRVPGITRYGPV